MRKILIALPLLAACAAGTQSVWLKPGASAELALREEAQCAAEARNRFPERRGIATSPSITIGVGTRICDGPFCAGIGTGREVYDYDRARAPRDQAFGACMGAKGYRLATLPRCNGSVTPLASQPFDTRGVCVTRDGRLAGN